MPSHHLPMSFVSHVRFVPVALLALGAAAQGSLPATAPTSLPQQVAPLSGAPPIRDAASRSHRAEVVYASGLMTVNAQNSSLNAILREISRQTGMKITGGVREERVFGHYGPALPSEILATLLGGTGTNMVLRETASAAPAELILTPRNGGPTPPNPNASGFDDDSRDDQDQGRPSQPAAVAGPPQNAPVAGQAQPVPVAPVNPTLPANNPLGDPHNQTPTASQFPTTNSVPTDSLPTPSTVTQQAPGIVDTPNQSVTARNTSSTSTGSSTTPSAPAGQKTAEQYYQELQQLRQQQQKVAAPQ